MSETGSLRWHLNTCQPLFTTGRMTNSMEIERSGGDLPWMVSAKLKKWIKFDFKLGSSLKVSKDGGPKEKWSCYRVKMSNVDMDGVEDGEYEIPFWAMDEFADLLEADDLEKGTHTAEFRRTRDKADENNVASFRVED